MSKVNKGNQLIESEVRTQVGRKTEAGFFGNQFLFAYIEDIKATFTKLQREPYVSGLSLCLQERSSTSTEKIRKEMNHPKS
jgi:hypothetical protein